MCDDCRTAVYEVSCDLGYFCEDCYGWVLRDRARFDY